MFLSCISKKIVAKTCKYSIFVAQICNNSIFVAKIYKYALIDSFQGSDGSLDSVTNYDALLPDTSLGMDLWSYTASSLDVLYIPFNLERNLLVAGDLHCTTQYTPHLGNVRIQSIEKCDQSDNRNSVSEPTIPSPKVSAVVCLIMDVIMTKKTKRRDVLGRSMNAVHP